MATIIIAGGGIGGLATALALRRFGNHDVVVLEKQEMFTEIGAGIQLGPNAFRALSALGVADAVLQRAVRVTDLLLMDGLSGTGVVRLPLGDDYRRRFGHPYVVVHRHDLFLPLVQRCQADTRIEMRPGSAVTAFADFGDGVDLALTGGATVRGDALIGADGIRSAVRRQLLGDGAPRISGHTIYRSVVDMRSVPEDLRLNAVALWAGPKWHFVHYPVSGGERLNLAFTRDNQARNAVSGTPVDRGQVLDGAVDLHPRARRLLELGREWRTWVLCDRDPQPRWTSGRVALMGDAAHPMLQYAAQGACMALEDAVSIGSALGPGTSAIPDALARYNAERAERTARTQRVSRVMGTRIYHPVGVAATARNRLLSSWSPEQLYDAVSWLHAGP